MDDTQRSFYGLKFENAYLREVGSSFEELFARIMGHAFPEDFIRVRPYGAQGDLKCDGYRSSDQTIFQCYAPQRLKQAALIRKIETDFLGAVGHWRSNMRRWSFVHNADGKGLPPGAVQKLETLRTSHPKIVISTLGYSELRTITLGLYLDQLEDLFGYVPTQGTFSDLEFSDLAPVLRAIQTGDPPVEPDLSVPSPRKLERNGLSRDAQDVLALGRRRVRLVEQLFEGWSDPDFANHIAEGFRAHYRGLKAQGCGPNEVFAKLQQFAGGMVGEPSRQAAVLAVLCYFFERCDIFENVSAEERP